MSHLAFVGEHEGEGADAGAILAAVARRQRGVIGFALAGRVVNGFEEASVLRRQDQVLNDDGGVAEEAGVGRKSGGIEVEGEPAMDDDAVELGALLPGLLGTALGLGGVVLRGRGGLGGTRGRKGGFSLLPLETSDLVLELLDLLAQGEVLGVKALDEVKEGDDGGAGRLIRNQVEIEREVEIGHRTLSRGATMERARKLSIKAPGYYITERAAAGGGGRGEAIPPSRRVAGNLNG
ncbi:MAG: hypothetical protein ACREXX_22735, partial [Gammaproteobacteria bacterium]